MSYHEAVEDGIRMGKLDGFAQYYPACHICGTEVGTWMYVRGTQYACRACRVELVAHEKKEKADAASDKKTKKLNAAIKRISKMTDIKPYAGAIEKISKRLDKPGWFQSTEEIMVALELVRRGIKAHHQVTVKNYKVDFVLPELKVALEIDGAIYHGKERARYDQVRDEVIVYQFGAEWEVVRIQTDNINKNITRLVPAIKRVLTCRKKKRETGGFGGFNTKK